MRSLAIFLVVVSFGLADADAQTDAAGHEFFEKEIRPLLAEKCQKCHGQDRPKGGLRLTSRASVLEGGGSGPAVVEGKPGESYLVELIRYVGEPKMPPDAKLADGEVAALEKWVEMGLPWPDSAPAATASAPASTFAITDEQRAHWAYQPVRDPATPEVHDASWPAGDLDRFILSKLEAEGLSPAAPADKRTLIRRATFDLTGLPPTPAEVDAFLADDSPQAFARVVDRLLASSAYGERWARHWLDVVRYADSLDSRGSGQPGDILDAWRFRDWVVDATNADLPYDQFIRMQVAGDVPSAPGAFSREGTVASTMLAIGNWGNGDADKDKILTDIADDQVDVVSKAFLGLTVSCARCHDHKFDPISQEDYYGLAGIFFSTHILPKLTPKGAGETIARVALASPDDLARRDEHARRTAELEKAIESTRAEKALALARALRPEAGKYVIAAREFRQSGGQDLDAFASSRGLHAFAVRRWDDALGGGRGKLLDQKTVNVGGIAGLNGWNAGTGRSSATVNPFDQTHVVATFTLPPRSISVHPGPASSAVISWRSPVAGSVRVTGRVADGDGACGDGFSWTLEHRNDSGANVLASGELANGEGMALGQSRQGARLSRIDVAPGDSLDLVIHRRGEYSCDTTTVDLVLSCWETDESWDLTRDTMAIFADANPMPDRRGRPGVWSLGDLARSTAAARPELAAALDAWRAAVSSGQTGEALAKAADALGQALSTEDDSSPFWIDGPAAEAALPAADRDQLATMRAELNSLRASMPPPLDYANAAQEGGVPESPHAGVHDVAIHLRGRYDRLGAVVPRRFPVILAGDPSSQPAITSGSGRKELADWLASPSNPLTSRVMVNRVWQNHFGRGLVATSSNFGKLGTPPTHPDLLDWLATSFVRDGWSLKALHRRIMLSSTYQQSSIGSPLAVERDPDNRLLARFPRRRLESEALRDALLSASGALDPTRGGPAIRDFTMPRRGLYYVTIRSDRATYGSLFDQADPTAPVDRRVESTVAPQSLWLLNSPFALDQAGKLAARLLREAPGDDPEPRVRLAYALLFARAPTDDELAVARDTLAGANDPDAWTAYAQILLCSNEFMYID